MTKTAKHKTAKTSRPAKGSKAAAKEDYRGRPVNPKSARQKRLAEWAKMEAEGIEIKRGRPVDPNSAKQEREAQRALLAKKGVPITPGRPSADVAKKREKLLAAA